MTIQATTCTTIAFFDFDGTVTRSDSLLPFLRFVVGSKKFYCGLIKLAPVLLAYLAGLARNDLSKQKVLTYFLGGLPQSQLESLGKEFACQYLPKLLSESGMNKLRWHQSQGHHCILVSASLDVWLTPWSQMHGLEPPICTALEYKNQKATGKLAGNNCYGYEKAKRIASWLKQHEGKVTTYAYGDSKSDFAMLHQADFGFILRHRTFCQIDKEN